MQMPCSQGSTASKRYGRVEGRRWRAKRSKEEEEGRRSVPWRARDAVGVIDQLGNGVNYADD